MTRLMARRYSAAYVHGYSTREQERLEDQARTLAELLHHDTAYPAGSRVLEAGCGVGAQTLRLARSSPEARIVATALDGLPASSKEGGWSPRWRPGEAADTSGWTEIARRRHNTTPRVVLP